MSISGFTGPIVWLWSVGGLHKCDSCCVFECLSCCLGLALAHSSKDTFVKLWDLDTQHCFHTIVGHRSEVCDGVCVRACMRACVRACVCGDVGVWKCVGWNVGVVGVGVGSG